MDSSLINDLVNDYSSDRELAWIYKAIYTYLSPEKFNNVPITREEYFQVIHSHLKSKYFESLSSRVAYVQDIKFKCKASLLSDAEFSWIDVKDTRQVLWLWLQLYLDGKIKLITISQSESCRYKHVIHTIDSMQLSTEKKLKCLLNLKSEWIQQTACDTRELSWLIQKDKILCLWAENYILKKGKASLTISVEHTLNSLCLDPYMRVMGHLDVLEKNTKLELIKNLKAAWIQKKHRIKVINESQKASAINLSQKHASLLTEISAHYKHSSTKKTIEYLIESEKSKIINNWL